MIEQVDGRVADTTHEVLEMREMPFSYDIPGPHPLQLARDIRPEFIGTFPRSREQRFPGLDTTAVRRPSAPRVRQVQPAGTDETCSVFAGTGHEPDSMLRPWCVHEVHRPSRLAVQTAIRPE
jgi:hypothetical protein